MQEKWDKKWSVRPERDQDQHAKSEPASLAYCTLLGYLPHWKWKKPTDSGASADHEMSELK